LEMTTGTLAFRDYDGPAAGRTSIEHFIHMFLLLFINIVNKIINVNMKIKNGNKYRVINKNRTFAIRIPTSRCFGHPLWPPA
jgi:hypothetical protein